MEELSQKLKRLFIEKLKDNPRTDEPYLVEITSTGSKKLSRSEIAFEIENETEWGVKYMTNLLSLTLDLLARQKI